jgi:hypothetical protein
MADRSAEIERLADLVLAQAQDGRAAPEYERLNGVRGRLLSMSAGELCSLLRAIQQKKSLVIFPRICAELYPSEHLVETQAA